VLRAFGPRQSTKAAAVKSKEQSFLRALSRCRWACRSVTSAATIYDEANGDRRIRKSCRSQCSKRFSPSLRCSAEGAFNFSEDFITAHLPHRVERCGELRVPTRCQSFTWRSTFCCLAIRMARELVNPPAIEILAVMKAFVPVMPMSSNGHV
jgi:hypothetical protein